MNYLAQIDFDALRKAFPTKEVGPYLLRRADLTIGLIISELLKYLFVFAGLILLLYLIFGGFQIMTSAGDPGKMKEARAIVTNAIVGFLIIFVAYWLIQAVGIIFGIAEIKDIFK